MDIIGHQKIVEYLEKSLKRGDIAQAYLFSGPEHLGKFTLAKNFCEKLTGAGNAKINPDLNVISPQTQELKGVLKKKSIQIGEIRDLSQKMNLSSYFGHWKTAIIDEAELMTAAAQNAFLKTLEEPPAYSIFILVCHDEGKILPTIKSRCVTKRFNLVSGREIMSRLSCENRDNIIFWSFGRPGLALEFSKNPEALKKREAFKTGLERLLEADIPGKFAMAENLSKDAPFLLETLDIWSALLREKIMSRDIFPAISRKRAFLGLDMIEKCAALIRNTNSNVRLAMENLILNL